MMKLQRQFPESFSKDYKLNTGSDTGDLSMRLMTVLNHLRRIARSGTAWKQASGNMTQTQCEELLDLALCVRESLVSTSMPSSSGPSDVDIGNSISADDAVLPKPRCLSKKLSDASEVTHVQMIHFCCFKRLRGLLFSIFFVSAGVY